MTFVASEGQVANLGYMPSSVGRTRLQFTPSHFTDYAEIYRRQPEVRTVVEFLGRNIGSLGLHVFERLANDDRARVTDHPLAELIASPGLSVAPKTRYRLLDQTVRDRAIFDRAYWWKVKSPLGRMKLVRLPPRMVTPKGESWLYPERFEVSGGKGTRELDASEVVYFHGYDPDGEIEGVSAIESLRGTLAESWAAVQMRQGMINNGARISGYIKRPAPDQGVEPWSQRARQRFKEEWRQQYTGDAESIGGTPILEDGMEWVQAGVDPEKLQYIEARKLTREEVAAAYHIPPPMVGILDHATFGNIEEQHKMLYADTLGPWLAEFEQEIALQLLPDLDPNPAIYVEFNLKQKLQGTFADEAELLGKAVGRPYMTANEGRSRLNLPRVDGGDVLAVPLNMSVPGAAGDNPTLKKTRVDAAGVLIRSGFEADEALAAVGLDPITHTGLLPVTLVQPEGEPVPDEQTEEA